MRLSFGGLILAALTAAGVTWIVMMLGAATSVAGELAPEAAPGIALTVLVLLLFGLMVALPLGGVSAVVSLSVAFFMAERVAGSGPERRRALLIAGLVCGALYPALGWLTQTLGDGSVLRLTSYVFGFWIWASIYEGGHNDAVGTAVITMAPMVAGFAAGWVYEALTRPEPKGLTTAEGGAI